MTTPPSGVFRLTASDIASHFKHRCDRRFRWNVVHSGDRDKVGIGWNVPKKARPNTRPGIQLLMEAGDEFEIAHVEALRAEVGDADFVWAGATQHQGRTRIAALPISDFLAACRRQPLPRYLAQLEIDASVGSPYAAGLAALLNIDPATSTFTTSKPDLIEFIPLDTSRGRAKLRIWDFKGSQKARHDHFMQVAFYSFLLGEVLRVEGLDHLEVDTEIGVIRSQQEQPELFELAPYRLALRDFLRNRVPLLLTTPAADAHFHVCEKCSLCEYETHCRTESDGTYDLSRIPYISSESKRRLRELGIRSHRQLAALDPVVDAGLLEQARGASHDLASRLDRYIQTARALEDGQPRALESRTLQMPAREQVRIVLSAEQDAVSSTCFAVGFKTYEGWDAQAGRVIGQEQVFIARDDKHEAELLLGFLRALNSVLLRVDTENRTSDTLRLPEDLAVDQARADLAAAEQAQVDFRVRVPRIPRNTPQTDALKAERDALEQAIKDAKARIKPAERAAAYARQQLQKRLHIYVYDSLELLILKQALERHIFSAAPELLAEIFTLVRLFPPESILPDAETFRSIPGSIVVNVLRALVALPTPYQYDLRSVSERFRPHDKSGDERGSVFRPRYGFAWPHSNQVAFERIHDVWKGQSFEVNQRVFTPEQIYEEIENTVRSKLRATDSVIRRLKEEYGNQLLLRKEPFRLYSGFDPLSLQIYEALRTFTILEASLAELDVKQRHTLPVADRIATFECLRGLCYLPGADEADGSLWFTFDPACRDTKFEPGEFNVVLTPEAEPERLLGDIDGGLFIAARGKYEPYKVRIVAYDLAADPPRVRLQPDNIAKLREKIDLSQPCVLDKVYVDHTSHHVLNALSTMELQPADAVHIHELIDRAQSSAWRPLTTDPLALEKELRALVGASGGNPDRLLNPGQWRAWHGVLQTPLALVWGPPGTGKTHTIAHMLLSNALAARNSKRPLRILVTAFTHHAIGNVLRKVAELAERYGLPEEELQIVKAQGSYAHSADDELPQRVRRIAELDVPGLLEQPPRCIVVGATVWSTGKTMKKQGNMLQPWYDVVLVDEASQMKLPDAMIALCSTKPHATIILAGDDKQLPPIIQGTYPEQHAYMLSSIFAFVRHSAEKAEVTDRVLFQLEENFRMNKPLTDYPSTVLYRGRFVSTKPDIRITTQPPINSASSELLDLLLDPLRPVLLCRYQPPKSFTARNPLEAALAVLLAERLSGILVDQETAQLYQPDRFAAEGMAIISPHRAQNSLIRQQLVQAGFDQRGTPGVKPMPLVDTVDKLQGQERDVIIVSYGVADEEYAEAEAGFLLSSNRFNVAATRARHKLIVLCSDSVLEVVPPDQVVLRDAMMLKEFRSYCSDGDLTIVWNVTPYGPIPLTLQWKSF